MLFTFIVTFIFIAVIFWLFAMWDFRSWFPDPGYPYDSEYFYTMLACIAGWYLLIYYGFQILHLLGLFTFNFHFSLEVYGYDLS